MFFLLSKHLFFTLSNLYLMFYFSFYEDTSAPSLTSPEADKWPGEAIFPGLNYNQDFLVPELFLLENIDCLAEKYDDVEPEDELLSILEEIITEDEKKTEGESKLYTPTKRAKFHHVCNLRAYFILTVRRRTQSMDF